MRRSVICAAIGVFLLMYLKKCGVLEEPNLHHGIQLLFLKQWSPRYALSRL